MRSPVKIRLAKNSEGDIIRDLVARETGMDLKELDWSNISPYWLAAVQDNEIVGCCQLLVGYPMGIIEFLSFKKGLNDMQKARIIKKLAKSSLAGLMESGSTAVVSSVPFQLKSFKNILKKQWGAQVYCSGSLLIKMLV